MKRFRFLLPIVGALIVAISRADAQQTKSPQIVQLFREVVAKPSQSTVRVLVADKEVALGTIVSADGWILTKHSELRPGKITCKMPGGESLDAQLFGHDEPHDLAMLKVAAKELTPVVFVDSSAAKIGHWVASPGISQDPVAIGVVSVAARSIKGAKFSPKAGSGGGGYLGLALDLGFAGVKVEEVFPNNPAQKAGIKAGDQIVALNGEAVDNAEDFRALLSRSKPGDEIKLKIVRENLEQELTAKLVPGPGAKGGKSRSDQQNAMGSKLSDRRSGFPVILQHDSVVKPQDCGGPLVNLKGEVLGINISRAGRVESYAIPSEAIRPLLEKLKAKAPEKGKRLEKGKI